jgi:hypothetical protein
MWQFVQPHYIPSKTTDKKKKKKRTELRVCVSKNRGWNKKNPYVSKLTRVPPPPTPTGECSLQQKFLAWPNHRRSATLTISD